MNGWEGRVTGKGRMDSWNNGPYMDEYEWIKGINFVENMDG